MTARDLLAGALAAGFYCGAMGIVIAAVYVFVVTRWRE